MEMKNFLKDYYRKIRKLLKCPKAQKKKIMKNIKAALTDYCNSSEHVTPQDIYSDFGSPETIANYYLDQLEYADLKNYRYKTLLFLGLTFAIVALLLILVCIFIKQAQTITIVHSAPTIG